MNPKDKAKELVEKFFKVTSKDDVYPDFYWTDAKQCALICVDEIIKTTYMDVNKYWQQVKTEIEKL